MVIKELLNGTYASIKSVIPLKHTIDKPELTKGSIHIEFGVLIGIIGDVSGKLVLTGQRDVFSAIGQAMFNMPLEGEMLTSFSGELGNMLAGGLSTTIVNKGINTDITSPTIIEGDSKLSGFSKALKVSVLFDDVGEMHLYLLLD